MCAYFWKKSGALTAGVRNRRDREGSANARFSPDGRWLAYESFDSQRAEIYVQPLPASGAKWQISREGGRKPRWRRDGKELYFLAGAANAGTGNATDETLMAVSITASDSLRSGIPAPLFPMRFVGGLTAQYPYDVSPDGQRFLTIAPVEKADSSPITILLNWNGEPLK
jgi:hypothetical protein